MGFSKGVWENICKVSKESVCVEIGMYMQGYSN